MLWYEDGPAAAASRDIAAQLARRLGVPLLIGFSVRRFESEADARARVASWLPHVPGPVRVHCVADASAAGLIEAARAARAVQLVLSGESSLASIDALERMLGELSSVLILVR